MKVIRNLEECREIKKRGKKTQNIKSGLDRFFYSEGNFLQT